MALSMLLMGDTRTQLETEKMGGYKDLPARFSGAPSTLNTVPRREATAAGGKTNKQESCESLVIATSASHA